MGEILAREGFTIKVLVWFGLLVSMFWLMMWGPLSPVRRSRANPVIWSLAGRAAQHVGHCPALNFHFQQNFSSFPFFGLGKIAVMVEQYSLPDSVQISKNLIFFASSLFWKPFWVNTCLRGNMHCNGGDGIYVLFDGISHKSNPLIWPLLLLLKHYLTTN